LIKQELYIVCPPLYAVCPPLYAVCPPLYAVCPPLYAVCPPLYAVCPTLYAICPPTQREISEDLDLHKALFSITEFVSFLRPKRGGVSD
jgi:hypothetical protein